MEDRADAGDGDLNVTRGFVDRPIVPSGTGGFTALDAEGFVPNETVTLSVCCTGSVRPPMRTAPLAPSYSTLRRR